VKIRVNPWQPFGDLKLNFQVNDQTYFVDLAEEAGQWLVFVDTPNGPRSVPVYEDAAPFDDVKVVVEDQDKRKIVN
jgi:hypothetical protein